MSFKKVSQLAEKFQYKLAQQASAQAADVQDSLTSLGFFDPKVNAYIGSMLDTLGIDANYKVALTITVQPGFKVDIGVTLTPPDAKKSSVLKSKLMALYSTKMSTALKASKNKLVVVDSVTCGWFNY
jgi:hypothetical protein